MKLIVKCLVASIVCIVVSYVGNSLYQSYKSKVQEDKTINHAIYGNTWHVSKYFSVSTKDTQYQDQLNFDAITELTVHLNMDNVKIDTKNNEIDLSEAVMFDKVLKNALIRSDIRESSNVSTKLINEIAEELFIDTYGINYDRCLLNLFYDEIIAKMKQDIESKGYDYKIKGGF